MKLRKLNLTGDALATATGAFLFFIAIDFLKWAGLGTLLIAILAALIVFKISRDCDVTKSDAIAGPEGYPIKFFVRLALCTVGAASIMLGVCFPILYALYSYFHALSVLL